MKHGNRKTRRRLNGLGTAHASGSRSVAIARDVIQSIIITGDHNRVFTGDYELLRDAYLKPQAVFDRLGSEFVGREWLEKKIDHFIGTHKCGYFVIVAPGGMGKTAFLASLVRRRALVHHFSELAPGEVARAVKSLAAQIIVAYRLDPYEGKDVLPASASRPDHLYDLLKQASVRRTTSEPVVLVIDALDEAGTLSGQNVLGLPRSLPEGVFIIASQRPMDVALTVEDPQLLYRFPLLPQDPDNTHDLEAYLDALAKSQGMEGAAADRFKEILSAKSGGLWIYLRFVNQEIKDKKRSAFDLDRLPAGLTEYYKSYWKGWRTSDESKWYSLYLPLLGVLAASKEPVTADQILACLSGSTKVAPLRAFLREQWGAFVAISGTPSRPTYWLNHATLMEFFEGSSSEGSRDESDEFLNEVSDAVQHAHNAITDHYLQRWNGWASGLSRLPLAAVADEDEAYALRHMSEHLLKAQRYPELHDLLALTRPEPAPAKVRTKALRGLWDRLRGVSVSTHTTRERLAWYRGRVENGSVEDFLGDVARAWQLADHLDAAPSAHAIGLQCRYALMTASPRSVSSQIPPKLLPALVQTGVWQPLQAFSFAIQTPEEQQQRALLLELVSILGASGLPEKGFAAAKRIAHGRSQGDALAKLARYIPESLWPEVLDQARLLVTIPPHRLVGLRVETDKDIVPTWRAEMRANILNGLAGHVPAALYERLIDVARDVSPELDRAFAFAAIIPHAPAGQAEAMLRESWAYAALMEHGYERSMALLKLARFLAKDDVQPTIDEALQVAAQLEKIEQRDSLLKEADLVVSRTQNGKNRDPSGSSSSQFGACQSMKTEDHLVEEKEDPALLLKQALAIKEPLRRAERLAAIAPYLPPPLLARALVSARRLPVMQYDLPPGVPRIQALLGIAPHLADLDHEKALDQIVALLRAEQSDQSFLNAITRVGVLPKLAEMGRVEDVVALVRNITLVDYRVRWWSDLYPHLSETQRIAEARAMLGMAQEIHDDNERAGATALLSAYMGDAKQAVTFANSSRSPFALFDVGCALVRMGHLHEAASAIGSLPLLSYLGEGPAQAEGWAAVAPHVPRSLLRSPIVALAKKLTDAAAVRTLAVLMGYVAEAERPKLLARALSALATFKEESAAIESLVALAPWLSEDVNVETLRRVGPIDSEKKTEWLTSLTPHLSEKVVRQALATAKQSPNPDPLLRFETLRIFSGRLPSLERKPTLEDALEAAWEIPDRSKRDDHLIMTTVQLIQLTSLDDLAECLRETSLRIREQGDVIRVLASRFSQACFGRVLESTQSWPSEHEWSQALMQMSAALAREGHPNEALVLARAITSRYSVLRVKALMTAVPLLPELQREPLIREGFKEIKYQDSKERRESLRVLVPFLEALPRDQVYSIWRDTLHESPDQTRPSVLTEIAIFAPAIARLGGKEAIWETLKEIHAVAKWFP